MDKIRTKKRRPLQRGVFTTILGGSIVMVILISTVVYLLYAYSSVRTYKRETKHDMQYAVSLMDESALEKIIADTKEYYYSTPESVRADVFGDGYVDGALAIVDKNPKFWELREILEKCRVQSELSTIGLVFSDEATGRIVFVVDGDIEANAYAPGQWISNENGAVESPEQIRRIVESEWYMTVAYSKISGWLGSNYIEVKSQSGEVIGLMYTGIDMNELVLRLNLFWLAFVLMCLAIVFVLAKMLSNTTRINIVAPINSLARVAREYTARDKVENNDDKFYFAPLEISTGNEIEDLWNDLKAMEHDMNDTMERIRVMSAEQEHANAELKVAREIQAERLPNTFPAFPDRDEFELYAMMTPAKMVGGDFYDFFLIDDDHLALIMADVSGKGIPASLFMVNAKTLIKDRAMLGGTPAETLSFANEQLCEGNNAGYFVTVWMAIIEIPTGKGIVSNAGHEDPVIKKVGGRYEAVRYDHSPPVAVIEGMKFEQHEIQLDPGDTIFVYTDGIPEAMNSKDEQFGMERLIRSLNDSDERGLSQKETLDNMMSDINTFVGECEQFDDTTMLIFRYDHG